MQPGEIIALAALVFTVFTFVAGAAIRSFTNRIAELQKEKSSLETKIDVLKRTLEAKQETIDEQHRQLDRLIITAEIQEKFFSRLPRHLPPSEARDK